MHPRTRNFVSGETDDLWRLEFKNAILLFYFIAYNVYLPVDVHQRNYIAREKYTLFRSNRQKERETEEGILKEEGTQQKKKGEPTRSSCNVEKGSELSINCVYPFKPVKQQWQAKPNMFNYYYYYCYCDYYILLLSCYFTYLLCTRIIFTDFSL